MMRYTYLCRICEQMVYMYNMSYNDTKKEYFWRVPIYQFSKETGKKNQLLLQIHVFIYALLTTTNITFCGLECNIYTIIYQTLHRQL